MSGHILKLFCYLIGDECSFPVNIQSSKTVGELKGEIKTIMTPTLDLIPTNQLRLWAVNLADDADLASNAQKEITGNPLGPPSRMLSKVFPSPDPSQEKVHIVVTIPDGAVTTGKRRLASSSTEEPTIKMRRTAYYTVFPSIPPSSLAKPARFSENVQKNPEIQMFCNRPQEAASTPITLLHPILGQFVDDCKVDTSNPKINLFVRELAKEMCKFYDEERSRAQKFRDLIWDHFKIKLEAADIPNTTFTTDDHATVGYYVYIHSEGKNEACGTKADPALQTAIYYHHHTKNVSLEVLGSVFPCIHIYYFGACLGFSGSAFSDRVHFEPLTEILPLCWSHHETEMFNRAARIFNAFKNAAERLVTYYEALASKSLTCFNHKNARFPYPTTFTALNSGSLTPFTLTEQPYPDKLLYSGFADQERPIVVKFVRTYSKDLHEFCVALNSAPTLLGFDELPGGWFMVVMEFMMDYIPLSEVKKRNLFESAHLNTIHGMVSNVVDKFHNANFVHGDVRDANILVPMDGANVVKFVDFDWGGKVQEVRYPPLVNNIPPQNDNMGVWRPPGAFDGELITTEHDKEMVKHMFT